jgi:hypothetical protein
MVAGILSGLSWFTPIFAFLLVLFLVFALLKKTEVIGDNDPVMFFVSFIVASFFVLEAQLVNFVEFITGWVGVLMVVIFFILLLLMFAGGRDFDLKFLTGSKGFSWALLAILVILLVVSTAYVFNWVINWALVKEWFMTDWFGFILLVVLGFGAYSFMKTKAK